MAENDPDAATGWLFATNRDRLSHFAQRIVDLDQSPADWMIVLIHVDDPSGLGRCMADVLMPGADWDAYRNRGEHPLARGLAGRKGIMLMLSEMAPKAALALSLIEGVAVLAVDSGTFTVRSYSSIFNLQTVN